MTIKWYQVEGTQAEEPDVLDKTSSSDHVYLRKDITHTTRVEEDGTKVAVWKYSEACLTLDEYESYLAESESLLFQTLVAQQEAADTVNADILLTQAEIQATQEEQDEVLADILINTTQMEV